jgi:hypothetical protein
MLGRTDLPLLLAAAAPVLAEAAVHRTIEDAGTPAQQ